MALLITFFVCGYLFTEHFVVVPQNEIIKYSNTKTEHHPIDSLPIDIKVKYKKTPYYEDENEEYLDILKSKMLSPSQNNFTSDDIYEMDANDKKQYDVLIENLQKDMKKTFNIQVVHDKFIKQQKYRGKTKMIIETILYSENKFQGKHIEFTIIFTNTISSIKYEIIDIKLLGVVPEDKIFLFPVVGNDPLLPEYDFIEENNESEPIIAKWDKTNIQSQANGPIQVWSASKDKAVQDTVLKHTLLFNDDIQTRVYRKLVQEKAPIYPIT